MPETATITITVDAYQRLLDDSAWLGYLEAAGVDNWEGISFAYELRNEEKDQ